MSEGSSAPVPSAPVNAADRDVAARQIRDAVARDQVSFDDLDDLYAAVYRSQTRAELDVAVAGLPEPPPPAPAPVPHPVPTSMFAVFGDIRKGGDLAVEGPIRCYTVFGDITLDLSAASGGDDVDVAAFAVFGDVTVIVPEGARVAASGMSVFGDRIEEVSPALAERPTVRVKSWMVFGDNKVYSLSRVPEGRLRRWWRSLRSGGADA